MSLVPVPPNASDVLVRVAFVAQTLGRCRRAGTREEFEKLLEKQGMTPGEAAQYWEHVDEETSMKDVWTGAMSNRELATALGIFLKNNSYPRSWLLYRLVELALPNILRTKLLGSEHMGGAKSRKNRWKPNPALANRRIIQFDVCPHNGKPNNPLAVYQLFTQAAQYV